LRNIYLKIRITTFKGIQNKPLSFTLDELYVGILAISEFVGCFVA